jgi:hypothetical protein
MQPNAIMQSLLPCTKHLINSLSIPVKVERWRVAYVLCCFRAFINISIDESKVLEFIAELAEGWKNLATNTAPAFRARNDSS